MVSRFPNQKGMTLLEVLGAVVIVGVVCFGFITWVHFFGQGISSGNQNDGITNAMTHLSAAFGGDDRYCTAILGGTALSTNVTGSQVPSIDYYNLQGVKQGNVITLNQITEKRSDLIVADIRLRPVSVINAQDIFANLEVTFRKGKNSLGSSEVVRKIPINATVQAGKVVKCSTSPTTAMNINNRICELKNDGFAHFDLTTNACVDNANVKWFTGPTPFTATCPSGYRPAVSALNPNPQLTACYAQEAESDAQVPPRLYTNGYVDDSIVQVWTAKVNGSPFTGCIFAYDATATLTNARGRIKCVEN
jgi:hypothetical protein